MFERRTLIAVTIGHVTLSIWQCREPGWGRRKLGPGRYAFDLHCITFAFERFWPDGWSLFS